MKNELKIFVPFLKVNKKKKMVYGYATTEVEDSQGEIVEKKAIRKAWEDYMRFANIREMHQNSAVGVTKEFLHDDKGTWIGGKIVDKDAWEKVLEGVYKGFSIGGKVLRKVGNRIKDLILSEISVVDRPANPEAVFTMVKRDDSGFVEVNKAKWTTAFINKLPDVAFAIVLPGGKKDKGGKTVPRNLRKLPHHNGSVKSPAENSSVDLVHLRNALARAPQMKGVSDAQRKSAIAHLKVHAKVLLKIEDENSLKVDPLLKIIDNFMRKENEIEKARRNQKTKEEEGAEEKEDELEQDKNQTPEDQTTPPEEGKDKDKDEEEGKEGTEGGEDNKEEPEDTVPNKELGTSPRDESTVPNKELGKQDEDEEDDDEEDDEEDGDDDEDDGDEDEGDDEDAENDEEDDEEEEGLEKDVSEVVVLSEIAGNLKWLKGAFENNDRPKEVIKYVEKALESVMAAIRIEAKNENMGKIGKINNVNDLGKLLSSKLGKIAKMVKSSNAKAKKVIKRVSSLEERVKKIEDEPTGQRPKTIFTVQKGEGGSNEPQNVLTIKKEIQDVIEEIDAVHKEGVALVGTTNPQKEEQLKEKLDKLGKKLAEKKRELNEAVFAGQE